MNQSPNQHPVHSEARDKIVPTDGWMTEPRPDILSLEYKLSQSAPGLNPDAMRKGPTEGHISVISKKPEVDPNIEPLTSSGDSTPHQIN